mgnify:CR=1 FL=1
MTDHSLTDDQLKLIAREAGKEGANVVLADHWRIMGWDINDPQDVKNLQRFFSWGRQHKATTTAIATWLTRGFVGAVAAGVLTVLILGIKSWIANIPISGAGGGFH